MSNSNTIHDHVINHLRLHFDEYPDLSLKEIIGDVMVHVIPSAPDRNYMIIATSGSNTGNNLESYELLMYLPADWNLSNLKDSDSYWPVAWIRKIANYTELISPENTFSNEDSFEPLASNTKLSGFLLLAEANDYGTFKCHDGRTKKFLDVIPLYKEEIELKKQKGTIELLKRFQDNEITMILDLKRRNVAL